MNTAPQKRFRNPRAQHDFKGRPCSILAVGAYVPERVLTNADLSKIVDTSDEWITSRTGIKERRRGEEYTGYKAGIAPPDHHATITRHALPATLTETKIGAFRAAFDIEAVFRHIIRDLSALQSRNYDMVLVIGAKSCPR